jgi:c(7)-type cytochrome triheme protein
VDPACARCHPQIPARRPWQPSEAPRAAIEAAKTWAEAAQLLPERDGAPDWTKALATGVIAPRPGIGSEAKDEDTLDQEIVRTPGGDETAKVVFPHDTHTAVLTCDSCHPEPYEMQAGATKMSMPALEKGQFCGSCHGTVAFPLDACGRCHPAMKP